MGEEAVVEDAPAEISTMPFGLAVAIGCIAVPASIVPVRSYAGETEDEALERLGINRDPSGPEILFVHLD